LLFKWLIPSWFNFVWSNASRNLFISSIFSTFFEFICKVFPHDLLDFIGICCNITFFTSKFINLGLFPPFSQISWVYRTNLSFLTINVLFHWLFIQVFLSLFYWLLSQLLLSFYLITLGLACFCFLRCLKCILKLFIWDHSVSLM
jgi:hypothetical protein